MVRLLSSLLFLLASADSVIAETLFADDSVLLVTLEGPLSQTLRNAKDEPEYLPYTLRTETDAVDVEVRPRGSSRRDVCRFPPLRLKLPPIHSTGVFAGQNKLKLVTHCNSNREYEQNVLEEYAAYRILNILTDASFRVRLLKVTYLDSDRVQRRPPTRWAFAIENVDALAARLNGAHVEPDILPGGSLEARHAVLVSMFQYFIGNTDYSLSQRREGRACCHNAKLIQTPAALLSIPYDFDQAGLIDARYAGPNPVYAARDVRHRAYLGICTTDAALLDALQLFKQQRTEILSLFDNIAGMSDATRKRAQAYLRAFYARLAKNGVSRLQKRCRKM